LGQPKLELLENTANHVGGWTAFEHGWKRFIMRYLRRPDLVSANHPLQIYVTELVRFPGGSSNISGDLQLAEQWDNCFINQSLSILKIAREKLREEQEKAERAQKLLQNQSCIDGSLVQRGQNKSQSLLRTTPNRFGGAANISRRGAQLGCGRPYRAAY